MENPQLLPPQLSGLSYEEWLSRPYAQTLATSDALNWHNIAARVVQMDSSPDYSPGLQSNDDILILMLEGYPKVENRVSDGRHFITQVIPGTLTLIPRHIGFIDGRWDKGGKTVCVSLSSMLVEDIAASISSVDPERIELLQDFCFYDPLLHHLCTELYLELQNGGLFGSLFAESVANTMMLYMLRKHSNLPALSEVSSSGQLTPSQIRIVEEFIQSGLHQKISLADLANCIHMSVPHFEKMFRLTFHCPPYRYVLERKIERAKLLLCHTQQSLYDVARDCGFADQSHFTRHFTKFVGVSPARFIRHARS